jgi:hypothetical protein
VEGKLHLGIPKEVWKDQDIHAAQIGFAISMVKIIPILMVESRN